MKNASSTDPTSVRMTPEEKIAWAVCCMMSWILYFLASWLVAVIVKWALLLDIDTLRLAIAIFAVRAFSLFSVSIFLHKDKTK